MTNKLGETRLCVLKKQQVTSGVFDTWCRPFKDMVNAIASYSFFGVSFADVFTLVLSGTITI